ncbi:MAG: iron ABC transporter substrate-binding protein [Dehalococcoidales bacterium]|nr:iron ABC transporter substrate-binding protein [Dehalococcoidales bacterium]
MKVKKIIFMLFTVVISASLLFFLSGCKGAQTTTVTNTTTKISTQTTSITDISTLTETITETVSGQPSTRTIVDDAGRSLVIPTTINKVLCCGPVECILTYMLAPEKLGGWCFLPNSTEGADYFDTQYADLPVVGGWYGKSTGNYETFISLEPDIILASDAATVEERQQFFGSIPVVSINVFDNYNTMPESILKMGDLLGVEEQAQKLVDFYEESVDYVTSVLTNVSEEDKVTVYYAEGDGGLSTDPSGSQHTELIDFCGGLNVAVVDDQAGFGMTSVSMEQILLWNPDIIIIGRAADATLYNQILSDPIWANLQAVKDGRVYLRPNNPFSWFDGPAGMNEIVGIYWMIQTLYPEQCADLDLKAKVQEFYLDFYHYNLTDADYEALMANTINTA